MAESGLGKFQNLGDGLGMGQGDSCVQIEKYSRLLFRTHIADIADLRLPLAKFLEIWA
jgi:hypothetical protein